jgi:nucleotide-binding universal stress UspA family protein
MGMEVQAASTSAEPWWAAQRRWVVGMDGSDAARTALRWAAAHAPGRSTALQIVSAWEPPIYTPALYGGPLAIPYDLDEFERAASDEIRHIAAETGQDLDVPVQGTAVCAGPSTALLDASADAALLVVGSRGRGGFSRLLLGSTSSQCATHATVPTAVVHHDWVADTTHRILVGLDGSPNSLTALDWALRFAGRGTTVNVMWVWDTTPLAVGADEFFFPDAGETAEARFHHLVDRVITHLDVADVEVQRTFWRGRPREDLAMASADVDLVVTGARGHGAVGAALLGSVSSWLLHRVERPMVVVPHPADVAATAAARETTTEGGAAA